MISDKCHFCGKKIHLIRRNRTYRWVDNPTLPDSWGCLSNLYSRFHAPWEYVDAENRARKVSTDDAIKQGYIKAPETESENVHDLDPEANSGRQI